MKTKVFFDEIEWDTDGEFVASLPKHIVHEFDTPDDIDFGEYLSDWLTNTYGYCHNGFAWHDNNDDTLSLKDFAKKMKKEWNLKESVLSLIKK